MNFTTLRITEAIRSGRRSASIALAALVTLALPALGQRAAHPDRAVAAAAPDSARQEAAGSPVVFRGDTLFVLRGSLGPFTATARAQAVAARLTALARTVAVPGDTVAVADRERQTDLLIGGTVLMSVLDADTVGTGRGRPALAREWGRMVGDTLAAVRRAARPAALLVDGGLAILATAVLLLLLFLMRLGFPRLYAATDAVRRVSLPTKRWQALRLVPPARVAEVLLGAVRLLRVALTVLLFYFYVPLVLSFFPWTEGFSRRLAGYAVTPFAAAWSAFISYLPNVFYIAAITIITRYLLKFIHTFFNAIGDRTVVFEGFHRDWAKPTYGITRVLVLAFAAVVVFPYLPGAQSDAFKGVSLFLGVLFSLGSSSAISNAVAGIVLTYTRAFQIGDRVQIGDTVGDVTEKTMLVTRIRTIKNVEVTIPNASVLNAQVLNYTTLAATRGLILHTTVTIGYDAPWKTVHQLLIDAARRTEHIKPDPAPFVFQTSLDDFYVSYQINAVTDRADLMAAIYSELHTNIQETFNAGGVEIMSAHYGALRDGNKTTTPDAHLPKDYVTPSFLVSVDRPPGPTPGGVR